VPAKLYQSNFFDRVPFSGSQDIAEYNNGAAPSSPSSEFIYSDSLPGSGLLASIVAGTTTYFHSDHLGWRVSTNTGGQVVGQQGTFPSANLGIRQAPTSLYSQVISAIRRVAWITRWPGTTTARLDASAPPTQWAERWMTRRHGTGTPTREMIPSTLRTRNGQHWWNWVLDIGSIAAMIFAPEIEGFLEDEFPLTFGGGAGAPAGFVSAILSAGCDRSGCRGGGRRSSGRGFWWRDRCGRHVNSPQPPRPADDQPKPQQQGRPQVSPALTPCQQKVLNAVNKQFGTNGNASDVSPSSNPLPASGGEVNVISTSTRADRNTV